MEKTANNVLKVLEKEIGVKESPANSNNVKYNTWFYGHSVSGSAYSWCAVLLDWGFEKSGAGSLYPHNANAAYAQDEIVSKCGGKWIMKKTSSAKARKAALAKAKPGDIVDFDFGAMDCYRRHTGIIKRVTKNGYITIEGNTSVSGSQSNGGAVCEKTRNYKDVCSIARPAYDMPRKYQGKFPELPTKIEKRAVELAYKMGTPVSVYKYHGGKPVPAYRRAIPKAYKKRNWSKQCRKGASCDIFVGVVVRIAGAIKSMPRGLDQQKPFLAKCKKVRSVKMSERKGGDILVRDNHIAICVEQKGERRVANAHHNAHGGTFAIIERSDNFDKCYRVKNPKLAMLTKGDTFTSVKFLRRVLNRYGDYKLDEKMYLFNDAVEKAVKDFQEKEGLKVDGKVGKATLTKLKEVL